MAVFVHAEHTPSFSANERMQLKARINARAKASNVSPFANF